MKAIVNTKSNYRGLNGKLLNVKEIVGTRVSCLVDTEENGLQTVDFHLKEITELYSEGREPSNIHPIFSQLLKPFGIQ